MSGTVRQIPSITNVAARQVVAAAISAAEALGRHSAVAVVDATGQLSAFARMDGAPMQSAQIAQDKAYTAAGFGMPTSQWHDILKHDEPMAMGAPTAIARLVPISGGLPIIVDGQTVGGIGVSGGHWTEDNVIAQEGIKVIKQ